MKEKLELTEEQIKAVAVAKPKFADAPAPQSHDRLTFVGYIHHEHFGEKPISFQFRTSDFLNTKHEPLQKRIVIPTVESQLNNFWIPPADIGYIVLENRTGAGLLVVPSQEEQDSIKKQVFRVRIGEQGGTNKGSTVRPGMFYIGEAEDFSSIWVQSLTDQEIQANMYLFPR